MEMQCTENARLVALATEEAARQGPIHATIVPEVPACWHIVETYPTHEFIAAAHLAARRFGIFLPSFTVRFKDRFKKPRSREKKLFPGYVFVFVWDILYHRARILSCPGVKSIVHAAGQAATVPFEMINHLRIREAYSQDLADATGKRRRRRRREPDSQEDQAPIGVTIRVYDALHGVETLDAEGRNKLLFKALGLAS